MRGEEPRWRRRALIFIIVISAIRLLMLPAMSLQPQDAYYWQYAKHLSVGYFDHPPVHAWTCRLTTEIFGDNAFGIRFGPWLYGVGLLLLVFAFAKRIGGDKTAFWTVAAAGVTPLFSIGSAILTPDPPLLFFWTLSVYLGYIALDDDRPWIWSIAGFAGGLAMLSKYTAVFLGAGFALALIFTETGRKHLKSIWPYLAIITAVIAFLPQIIWNAQNGWASFAYQSTRRAGEISRWRLDLFGGMLVSQMLLIGPILFIGVVWAGFKGIWNGLFDRNQKSLFLSAFTLPVLVFFTLISLLYWVKMNWLAPAYITGAVAFVRLIVQREKGVKLLKWAAGIAALETVLLYLIILIPSIPLTGEAAYFAGWRELAERIQIEREDMRTDPFVAGWGYKVSSELRFYLPDKPETFSSEILGFPGLNYEWWTDTDGLIGKDCIFVADSREPFRDPKILDSHFARVEEQTELQPERGGKVVTTYRIWRCFDYIGP